jgi:uncharacterized protein
MALPGLSFEIVRTPDRVPGVRGDRIGLAALTPRGPLEVPTLVRSLPEFRERFGCTAPGMLGPLAAEACFANGAEELIVCRVAPVRDDELARAAAGLLPQVLGAPLQLAAAEPGSFADELEVEAELDIERLAVGQLTAPSTLALPGATAADRDRVIRIFAGGRVHWARVDAVTTTPPALLFTPPTLGPFPADAVAQFFAPTFTLRVREPGRADVAITGLDRRDAADLRKRLRGSPLAVPDTLGDTIDLPAPGVVVRLDGGADGITDVLDDEPNREALAESFRRAFAALALDPLPDVMIAPDLWSRIFQTKNVFRLALDAGRAVALGDVLVRAAAVRRDRVVLLDPPLTGLLQRAPATVSELETWRAERATALGDDRDFAAAYAPWTRIRSPISFRGDDTLLFPPSAAVAGRIARTSLTRAPWIATGNVALEGVVGLDSALPSAAQERLQDAGINPIAMRTPEGAVIGGVRSLSWPDRRPWRFLVTRRLFNVLQRVLPQVGRSYVFEPNTPSTWVALRRDLQALLLDMFQRGAFAGSTPQQAFFIQLDESINPPELRDAGELHVLIAVAPAAPLEFLLVRLVLGNNTAKVVEA